MQHAMLHDVINVFAPMLLAVIAALLIDMNALADPGVKASAGELQRDKNRATATRESNLSLQIYQLFDHLGDDYGLPENACAMDIVAAVPSSSRARNAKAIVSCNANRWNCTAGFTSPVPEQPDKAARTVEDSDD